MKTFSIRTSIMQRIVDIIRQLRDPETGCKWDLKQTLETYREYLNDEMQELIQAIDKNDMPNLIEELGDNLFNLAFIIEMASEKHALDFDVVIEQAIKKMIRRHPHVFGDAQAATAEEAEKLYYEAKAKE